MGQLKTYTVWDDADIFGIQNKTFFFKRSCWSQQTSKKIHNLEILDEDKASKSALHIIVYDNTAVEQDRYKD